MSEGAGRGAVIPAEFFGMHVSYPTNLSSTQTPLRADLGYKTARFWDTVGVRWLEIETALGVYDWTYFDANIAVLTAAGIDHIIITGGQPPASRGGAVVSFKNPAPPTTLQDNADFLLLCCQRARGLVPTIKLAVEPWNEFQDTKYYTGTLAQMITMQQQAYTTIKAYDPTITVLTANVATVAFGQAYLAQLIAGTVGYFDAVAFHPYPTSTKPSDPEAIYKDLTIARGDMRTHGVANLPLWATEWGVQPYYVNDNTDTIVAAGGALVPDEQAADFVVRAHLAAWAGGAERFCFYAMDRNAMSLWLIDIDGDRNTLKPAFNALKHLAQVLTGGTYTYQGQAGYYHHGHFTKSDGTGGSIHWCVRGNSHTIDVSNAIAITDKYGATITPGGATLNVTSPVYVYEF